MSVVDSNLVIFIIHSSTRIINIYIQNEIHSTYA
jgi:hypothetical protein